MIAWLIFIAICVGLAGLGWLCHRYQEEAEAIAGFLLVIGLLVGAVFVLRSNDQYDQRKHDLTTTTTTSLP